MDYRNKIYNMDCLAGMAMLPDGCVDMVLTDLPYGTTAGAWDTLLPFEPLWRELHRVAKPDAAWYSQRPSPFTTQLIQSNHKEFRYCWYWIKNQVTGFPFAKVQPLRCVEEVAVFYRRKPIYSPQGLVALEKPIVARGKKQTAKSVYRTGGLEKTHCAAVHRLSSAGSDISVPARGAASHAETGGAVRVPGAHIHGAGAAGLGLLYGQRYNQGGLPECRPGLCGL